MGRDHSKCYVRPQHLSPTDIVLVLCYQTSTIIIIKIQETQQCNESSLLATSVPPLVRVIIPGPNPKFGKHNAQEFCHLYHSPTSRKVNP